MFVFICPDARLAMLMLSLLSLLSLLLLFWLLLLLLRLLATLMAALMTETTNPRKPMEDNLNSRKQPNQWRRNKSMEDNWIKEEQYIDGGQLNQWRITSASYHNNPADNWIYIQWEKITLPRLKKNFTSLSIGLFLLLLFIFICASLFCNNVLR